MTTLKHYIVKYADIAGQILKAQFDEFDEAVNFATTQVQGEKLYNGELSHNDFFWYEVYNTEVGEWNNDGILLDGFEDKIDEASVFCTRNYWK
jgi:hypothetical protein